MYIYSVLVIESGSAAAASPLLENVEVGRASTQSCGYLGERNSFGSSTASVVLVVAAAAVTAVMRGAGSMIDLVR